MDKATTTGTQALLQYNGPPLPPSLFLPSNPQPTPHPPSTGFVNQCISVSLAVSTALVSIPPATATQSVETVLYPLSSSSSSSANSSSVTQAAPTTTAAEGSATDLAAIAASISNKAVGAKASASASAKTAGAGRVGGWGRAGWVEIVGVGLGVVVVLW